MTKHIVVIGGGPGGYTAAIRAAQLGAQVTLIEKDLVGGTCLNRGCIPTKTLYRSAEILSHFKHASDFAIAADPSAAIDPVALKARSEQVSKQLRDGIEQLIRANAITYVAGSARFVSAGELLVTQADGSELSLNGDAFLVATGSVPAVIPIPGADLAGVITSDELLQMDHLPKSMAIVGGGVIGVEFASIYSAFGTEVQVVEVFPNLLNTLDADIAKRFTASVKRRGITAHTAVTVEAIAKGEDGLLQLQISGKKGPMSLSVETVLLATGRRPYFAGLDLEAAGVSHTPKGISVNSAYQTSQPHIYAVGDVIGGVMLAHWAAHQGITAVEHAMGQNPPLHAPAIPGCIFTFPEIASVGLSEEAAKERFGSCKTSKFMFGANGKALALGEGEGFVKVVADDQGVIVGMHIMGPHASDLIHEGVIAIEQGMRAETFKPMVHAHPTLSESVYEAILGLAGEAIHMAPLKK